MVLLSPNAALVVVICAFLIDCLVLFNETVHFRRICSQGVVCSQISHSQSDVCKSISACDDVLPRTLEATPHCCFGRKVKALPGVFLMTW